MKKALPALALAFICSACDGDAAPVAVPSASSADKPAAKSVDETKLLTDHDRELSAFWRKVRVASAARPDAPKKTLRHIVNTSDGPVVVEEEVVMEEYFRILEEEKEELAQVQRASGTPTEGEILTKEELRALLERRRSESRNDRLRLERDIEASQRRREALEAELQVERERDNRAWVIEQLEKDIAAEKAEENELRGRKRRSEDLDLDELKRDPRFRFVGRSDPNGCAPMPFGGSSLGPWDTGGSRP